LLILGFLDSSEPFKEHLSTCIRLLGIELEHHAKLGYEREAAAFIAEHVSTIAWRTQAELRLAGPHEVTGFENEKSSSFFPEFVNEDIDADKPVTKISEDGLFLQSNFAAVQRFILRSLCFERLIVRLEQWVDDLRDDNEAQTPDNQRDRSCARTVFRRTLSQIGRILEAKPPPGTIRIRWRCSCGAMMWDDYSQRSPEHVRVLQKRLNRFFWTAPNSHPTNQGSNISFNPLSWLQLLGNSFRALSEALSRGNAQPRDPENTTLPPSHLPKRDASVYLLTCADAGQGLPTLFQKRLNSVESDKAYFQMLHTLYKTNGDGWRKWLRFETVTAIEYVRVGDLASKEGFLHSADPSSSTRP